jgi:hypothetical protein
MHFVDAKRFIKIQVIRLFNDHEPNSKEIANYINRIKGVSFVKKLLYLF